MISPKSILLGCTLLLGLTACDTVSESDRFTGPLSVEAKKNVLIEDFTGQRCPNCPLAAEQVSSLQQAYGAERVIAVSIHGGSLSVSENTSAIGLANDQGQDYNNHWGVQSWPKGYIDRSGNLVDFEQWGARVFSRFSVTPKADLSVSGLTYDAATRRLTFTAHAKGEANVTGRLQVWLTESGIVAPQLMPTGGTNRKYVHNHVFRASVSAPYGDELTLTDGETVDKTYETTLKDKWVPDKMSLVIFFWNDQDGVMQVIDQAVL